MDHADTATPATPATPADAAEPAPYVDLGPSARRLGDLVANVADDRLGAPTPCPAYTLGDLIDHVGGLAVAFAAAARKHTLDGATGPSGDASRLGDDWRVRIPRDLLQLAEAWRDPAAWDGMTQAGGVDLPGGVCGLVALDELVVHGWDVARASGQAFGCERPTLEAVHGFLAAFDAPAPADGGPFGPAVPVPDTAPIVDRVVGLAGRDPGWAA